MAGFIYKSLLIGKYLGHAHSNERENPPQTLLHTLTAVAKRCKPFCDRTCPRRAALKQRCSYLQTNKQRAVQRAPGVKRWPDVFSINLTARRFPIIVPYVLPLYIECELNVHRSPIWRHDRACCLLSFSVFWASLSSDTRSFGWQLTDSSKCVCCVNVNNWNKHSIQYTVYAQYI